MKAIVVIGNSYGVSLYCPSCERTVWADYDDIPPTVADVATAEQDHATFHIIQEGSIS